MLPVDVVRAAQSKLECHLLNELSNEINDAIAKFHSQTGLFVKAVTFKTFETTSISSTHKTGVVGQVMIERELA